MHCRDGLPKIRDDHDSARLLHCQCLASVLTGLNAASGTTITLTHTANECACRLLSISEPVPEVLQADHQLVPFRGQVGTVGASPHTVDLDIPLCDLVPSTRAQATLVTMQILVKYGAEASSRWARLERPLTHFLD